MEMERYEHGVPSWVDLSTPDPEAAAAFYQGLFGWDTEDLGPDAGNYRLATLRGKQVAGIGPAQNPDQPPFWTSYVNVDDADAIPARVAAAGGTTFLEPFDVMDAGRMGVFADPRGAVFAVWQAKASIGAQLVNEIGTFSWSELVTSDPEGSKAFYGDVFGWGEETHGEGPGAYTEWKVAGRSVGGMMPRPPGMPEQAPDFWAVYFTVSDGAETVARVAELGGGLMMGPMEVEPGTIAVVTDPQGAAFNVIQLKDAG
ncbi:MAG TPA: VOC family protein [Acidimicrobiales bacterium]|jgi:predicted enzyme related to lactoylglutathione lyase